MFEEIISTLKSADNEGTESPYWLILDPRQMFSCNVHELGSMITGPFFSRDDAQNHLTNRRYGFSKHAKVYCMSGYWSDKYKRAYRALECELRKQTEKATA